MQAYYQVSQYWVIDKFSIVKVLLKNFAWSCRHWTQISWLSKSTSGTNFLSIEFGRIDSHPYNN